MLLDTLTLSFSLLASYVVSAVAQTEFGQCGGEGYTGGTNCSSGFYCARLNDRYSQCMWTNGTVSLEPAVSSTSTSAPTAAPTIGPTRAVGRTPALGWNSWNAYHCDINEAKVLSAANSFITLGLAKAGYEYVNIDDCWPLQARDATTGQIVPDSVKFPDGISGVASKVHALGLKLGIYSDAGVATCAGYPGSLGNEELDAATFAEWGVDYLKYDNCNVPGNWSDVASPLNGDWYNSNSAIRYRQMTAALAKTRRSFQFNICIWGNANVWDWGARVGHSWRMSGDSSPSWAYIVQILGVNTQHLSSIGFFGHNDMDMMEIGNGDLTIEEERTHFAIWTFLKSPILLGTDLSQLSPDQVAIITNRELLAFHQDNVFGGPAMPFAPNATTASGSPPQFFAGRSVRGTHVFLVNTGDAATEMSFDFAQVPGLGAGSGAEAEVGRRFRLHDMWTGTAVRGVFAQSFTVVVDRHDTAAFLVSRI